ncbi:MAG: carbamoyltransferase HypF [Actinomycetota bacterium]|nr:carbamoyltransferase HypF [Actinomycetota bacterium]
MIKEDMVTLLLICTNCGPRFTIIESLPYDRPQTTMKKFDMCPQCEHEYSNQFDRRFHAQPVACSLCGPKLWLTDNHNHTIECKDPIQKAVQKLKQGCIVAIKSLGGFQLAVDATNACAVKKLRSRKNRPHKPLAIMVGNIKQVKENFKLSPWEETIIDSPRAPIVLLEKKHKSWLAPEVSFYNRQEGVMLPYTPLHHLLFNAIDFPLIMTSGNNSEEPIARDNQEALDRLSSISDFFLLHNRDIYSRYDDSVVKVMDNQEMALRRARGYFPYPVKISPDTGNKTILALGAQEKNTFCILTHNYALISQHLGELDDLDSFNFFKETLKVYQRLFNIRQFDMVVHDKHPAYTSTRYARQFKNIPILAFQHHKAHIASVIAENHLEGTCLVLPGRHRVWR